MWDPDAYLRFADERARPFFELLARVPARAPAVVVDLGCGPGSLTRHLPQRWPGATVRGIDSSPEMIAAARAEPSAGVEFDVGDVQDWHPPADLGVVVTNAVLQWVPGHDALLARWADELPAGATLAFQVPGNFDSPSHLLIREVAALPAWRDQLAGELRGADAVLPPAGYAELLAEHGLAVDAWETTYLHELAPAGDDHPVLRWVEGMALRPVRSRLDDAEWARFRGELNPRLAAAYPVHNGRVWFPFRRIFVVAHH